MGEALSIAMRSAPPLTQEEVLEVLEDADRPLRMWEIGHALGAHTPHKKNGGWLSGRGKTSWQLFHDFVRTVGQLREQGLAVKLPHEHASGNAWYTSCSTHEEARLAQLLACEKQLLLLASKTRNSAPHERRKWRRLINGLKEKT